MSNLFSSSCMIMCAAFACLQHLHGCGTCTNAACAWWRHMHGCEPALVRQMHMCGILMLVPCWPPPRRSSFASLAASPCASCNTSLATANAAFALDCATTMHEGSHQGTERSEGASPRSFLQGRHGLKPAPPHVGLGSQHGG